MEKESCVILCSRKEEEEWPLRCYQRDGFDYNIVGGLNY